MRVMIHLASLLAFSILFAGEILGDDRNTYLPMDDTTPPAVTATSPSNGSHEIPTGSSIEITFSEPMDRTYTEGAFIIDPSGREWGRTWNSDGTRITYTPDRSLYTNVTFEGTVLSVARDVAGNRLTKDYIFSFTTISGSLQISELIREKQASYNRVEITFSEVMERPSIEQGFSVTPSVSGRFEWEQMGPWQRLTYTITNLQEGTEYSVTLHGTFRTADGKLTATGQYLVARWRVDYNWTNLTCYSILIIIPIIVIPMFLWRRTRSHIRRVAAAAKVYRIITINEIAAKTDLPRAKVDKFLAKAIEKGLIRGEIRRPEDVFVLEGVYPNR
jgi:hypothetical protein